MFIYKLKKIFYLFKMEGPSDEWFFHVLGAMQTLRNLKDGWHGESSHAIDVDILILAEAVLLSFRYPEIPMIGPSLEGYIDIEFKGKLFSTIEKEQTIITYKEGETWKNMEVKHKATLLANTIDIISAIFSILKLTN
jgi:hypothetical protein